MLTFLWSGGRLGHKIGFFERTPFEVFLVASTLDVPLVTLQTSRLGLIAFQPLCLARNAACEVTQSALVFYFLFLFLFHFF